MDDAMTPTIFRSFWSFLSFFLCYLGDTRAVIE